MERLRGCFNGYGGASVFPTKADRIMSRYRPIAPKPAMPCITEVERCSASSAVTMDSMCMRPALAAAPPSSSVASKPKSRRTRKRPSKDAEAHPQPAKRPAMEPSPMNPHLLNAMGCISASSQAAPPAPIQDDAGFMERAAASAPPSVLPLERLKAKAAHSNSYGYGGSFRELIRGIAGLPTANHVDNLLQHHQQQQQQSKLSMFLNVLPQHTAAEQMQSFYEADSGFHSEERESLKDELYSDAVRSCFSDAEQRDNARDRALSEDAQQSGLDEEGIDGVVSKSKGIVTLNLLPEVPMTADSPTLSSSSCESSHIAGHGMSLAYIEQVYWHSSEPVILTDDSTQKLLWANQAYLRACKESSRMVAPFIDPLGLPTQLRQFQLQLENCSDCIPAKLWGFLRKFVVDRAAHADKPRWLTELIDAPFGANLSVPSPLQQHVFCANQSDCQPLSSARVIIPQPIRLVGSVVSVESVSEIQHGDAMAGTLELAKKDLEEGSLPGLITDSLNVVRWVNTAYKVMVGQPECPWLASTMKEEDGTSLTITGEVLLSCNVEFPVTAKAFSGRVNVQWTRNAGERTCMTLPCDVLAFTDGHLKRSFVWRFDIQASLSLSCGT